MRKRNNTNNADAQLGDASGVVESTLENDFIAAVRPGRWLRVTNARMVLDPVSRHRLLHVGAAWGRVEECEAGGAVLESNDLSALPMELVR